MVFRCASVVLFVLGVAVPSQTFVVDASNGPGTDFTNLATATATVPDGATLVVRPGVYLYPVDVIGKGLTIAGQTGAVVAWLSISGQSPLQRVVVRGLQFGVFTAAGELRVQSCQAAVSIEDCTGAPGPNWGFARLIVTSCPEVSVARSEFRIASTLTGSHVCCSDTLFGTNYAGGAALTLVSGRTDLANCTVQGSTNGITATGSYVRLLGTTSVIGLTGVSVQGSGILRVSPSVGSLAVSGIAVSPIDAAAARSTAATLGGTVAGTLVGSANLYGALYFGLVRPPVSLPGVSDLLWIEPYDVPIAGVLDTPLGYVVQIPNEPGLRGFTFGWQGVSAGIGGVQLSNPVLFSVR